MMNRCEWILIGSSGEAEAEPPELFWRLDAKPEAYRYVLRQSRIIAGGADLLIMASCPS
jgi:hypothetical protein